MTECPTLYCQGFIDCITNNCKIADCENDCDQIVTSIDNLDNPQEGDSFGLVEAHSGSLVRLLNTNDYINLSVNFASNNEALNVQHENKHISLTNTRFFLASIIDNSLYIGQSKLMKNTPLSLLTIFNNKWFYFGFTQQNDYSFIPYNKNHSFSIKDTFYILNARDLTEKGPIHFGDQVVITLKADQKLIKKLNTLSNSHFKTSTHQLNNDANIIALSLFNRSENLTTTLISTSTSFVDFDHLDQIEYFNGFNGKEHAEFNNCIFQITWSSGCLPPKINTLERIRKKSAVNRDIPPIIRLKCSDCVAKGYQQATITLGIFLLCLVAAWIFLYFYWRNKK